MVCEECGCCCDCEDREYEPFIGPMNAPVEGPPTVEQWMANEISRSIFDYSEGRVPSLAGLAAVIPVAPPEGM